MSSLDLGSEETRLNIHWGVSLSGIPAVCPPMDLFSACGKPFQPPQDSLESRAMKRQSQTTSDDPFSIFTSSRKPRNLSTRSTAFGRVESVCAIPPAPATRTLARFESCRAMTPEEELEEAISQCVECAADKIEFSSRGLKELPAAIGDLKSIVALDRFKTTLSLPCHSRDDGYEPSTVALELYLANNLLTHASLQPALFTLTNLTVLSLRGNPLSELPAAMGNLQALRELYLGANGLQWLPAEIQQLDLQTLLINPNPFLEPKDLQAKSHPTSKRLLAPLKRTSNLPSLRESCFRLLLSKPSPSSVPLAQQVRHLLPHLKQPHLRHPLAQTRLSKDTPIFDPSGNACHCRHPFSNYAEPLEERFEFARTVAGCAVGSPGIPIKWRGCLVGCLGFLEEPTAA